MIMIPMLRTVTSHRRLDGLMECQMCQAVSVGRQLHQAASTDHSVGRMCQALSVGRQLHQAASTDHSVGRQLHQAASTDHSVGRQLHQATTDLLPIFLKHQMCQAVSTDQVRQATWTNHLVM
jgi:hypothetical protein